VRVVGFKRLVGRSADPTFLEAQAKFDLQKKMQKLLVSSEKEKNKPSPPQIRALLLLPFFCFLNSSEDEHTLPSSPAKFSQ